MSRERELLQRALEAVEKTYFPSRLADELRAELQKPEPVECGWLDMWADKFFHRWKLDGMENGKYRLLAEKIDDDR